LADQNATGSVPSKRGAAFWVGWVLGVIPAGLMLMSGGMKLSHLPQIVEQFGSKFGYPAQTLTLIGVLEVACAVLYLVPQTSVLGAILVVGYLGGAVATHVRILDPSGASPVVLGVLVWLGLWLRDPRLKALLPIRRA
jgi:hypothetical protein